MIIVYFQEMLYDASSEIQDPFDVTTTIKQVSVPTYVRIIKTHNSESQG